MLYYILTGVGSLLVGGVAAGAVAEAMAPKVIAAGKVIICGKHRCRTIKTMSTSTVVRTACRIPITIAPEPIAFS